MPTPQGRVGTAEFLRLTGISKTAFFTKYRSSAHWRSKLDIRFDDRGHLHMDEEATRALAASRLGDRASGRSPRADRLRCPCPHCKESIMRHARICRFCGRDVTPRE
jgi:hypothetical protein